MADCSELAHADGFVDKQWEDSQWIVRQKGRSFVARMKE